MQQNSYYNSPTRRSCPVVQCSWSVWQQAVASYKASLHFPATLYRLKIESHDGICNLSPVLKLGDLVIYPIGPIVRFGLLARCFCTALFRIQIRASGIAKALEGEVQQAAEKSMKPRSKKEDEARVVSKKIEHHCTFIYQFLNVDLFRVPGESFVMGLESLTCLCTGWRFQKTQSEREKSEETRCLLSFEFNVHLQELN